MSLITPRLGRKFYDLLAAQLSGDYSYAFGLRTAANASTGTLVRRTWYGGRKGRRAGRRLRVLRAAGAVVPRLEQYDSASVYFNGVLLVEGDITLGFMVDDP